MNAETLYLTGGVLVTLVGVIAMAARSLRTTSQAIGDLSKTNIALNQELKETAAERHKSERLHESERVEWKTERVDMQCQLDGVTSKLALVEADFDQYRKSSQQVIDQLGQELIKVKQELAEAREDAHARKEEAQAMKDSIDKLSSALATAQNRVKELEVRENQLRLDLAEAQRKIAVLERDNLAKDTEIVALKGRVTELESELQRVQQDRARLEQEKAELLRQLEGSTSDPDKGKPDEPEAAEQPQGEK
jgi:chromosome segregation ATPase